MNHPAPQIDARQAEELLGCEGVELLELLAQATALRQQHRGDKVSLCGILNAKSGRCAEDCSFCAQSAHHATGAPEYPLVGADEMVARAHEVAGMGAREYSIVTSGSKVRSEREIETICAALETLTAEGKLLRCASLGTLDREVLTRLKQAGLTNYHHNLETARSFFPNVCTTHSYDEDVTTVMAAKEVGLRVCCGGIFGLGESRAQRVELALTLAELDVDSVPLNFLNPIPGTPLAGSVRLTPLECLRIIAVYRLLLPTKDIFVCGGREVNLRDLQSWIFAAGANGMMVGNYLTTKGRSAELDLQMIADLGLEVMPCDTQES